MTNLLTPIAERRGDAAALIDEFGETSWRELAERINRLIHALRDVGLNPGDTFSVLSGNRREYYEWMLAAAHGGWRFVPVNWHWVAEEVAYVLDNSDSRALVADERFAALAAESVSRNDAPDLISKVVFGGEAPDGFVEYEKLLGQGSPDEPADQSLGGPMFYTSGTTGRPKGVAASTLATGVPPDAMAFVGKAMSGTLGMPEEGMSFLDGPVYHSAQWAFSFLPLVAGSSVVMRHKFDPAETLAVIDRYRVTNIHLVPTQFVRLLRLDDEVKAAFDGGSLKAVWHGAAPCPPDVKRRMIEWWGPVISEYYGSTEGSIVSTISAAEWLAHPGSLGKPLDTIEVRVVKEDGNLAAPGESGQLYVRNKLGSDFRYHKDPDKTAAAHLEPGVFTFGDVGYLDEDGYLFMSDRKIDMVISGGVNIYPAEIEGVLVTHPAVVDAAVFGIPNEEFGEEVKAAVELADGYAAGDDLERQLKDHCREHLAGYKTPFSIDFEPALPRHPTGKLYKRLLRDRYWKRAGRTI